ncbi:MAG: trypsin-like peptidase domain-containing protein, partial [Phycisphaerae bacterium]
MNRAVVMLVIVLIATSRGAAWPPPESDAASLARVRAYERARIAVIERVSPAVACLFNSGSRAGGGSGVIIDEDGYGLTNFHVVAGMLEDRAGQAGLPDGRLGDIDVLGIDPTGDVAMFRLHGR